jgi:hypothetical protein
MRCRSIPGTSVRQRRLRSVREGAWRAWCAHDVPGSGRRGTEARWQPKPTRNRAGGSSRWRRSKDRGYDRDMIDRLLVDRHRPEPRQARARTWVHDSRLLGAGGGGGVGVTGSAFGTHNISREIVQIHTGWAYRSLSPRDHVLHKRVRKRATQRFSDGHPVILTAGSIAATTGESGDKRYWVRTERQTKNSSARWCRRVCTVGVLGYHGPGGLHDFCQPGC